LNFVAILSVIGLITACTNPDFSHSNSENTPLMKVDNQSPVQLIIKFSSPLVSSEVEQKLQEISENTGLKLIYIREMSGNAYVISTQHTLSNKKFSERLDSIRKRNDVEYVEIDALVQPQHLMKKGSVK